MPTAMKNGTRRGECRKTLKEPRASYLYFLFANEREPWRRKSDIVIYRNNLISLKILGADRVQNIDGCKLLPFVGCTGKLWAE